jgi:hypothetical protein
MPRPWGLGRGTPSRFPYPGAVSTPAGVAPPGNVGVFRGKLVIVYGPSGTISGVFVYAPGTTPAKGNPPIAWMTGGTSDPYGNTVTPQIGSQASNGQGVVLQGADILLPGSNLVASGEPAAIFGVPAASTAAQSFLIFASPLDSTNQAVLLLAGESGNAATAAYAQFVQQTAADVQSAMQVWATGGVVVSQLGTVASPEGWHAVTLATGITGTIRHQAAATVGLAVLDINVEITSSLTTGESYVCGPLLNADYYPTSARQFPLTVNQGLGTSPTIPRVAIPTSGDIALDMPGFTTAGNTVIVSGTVVYPLD